MAPELLNTADLTPAQDEKRQQALQSVIRIVGESQVDGVSMKAVSADSGVALATLYRFFSSRDHMLAAALVEWQGTYIRRQREHALHTGSLSERVFQHLRVGLGAFDRNSNYLSLALLPSMATDIYASREIYRARMDGINLVTELLADLGPEKAAVTAQIIEACLVDHLVQWMTGRLTQIGVLDMLKRQTSLLLD